MSFAIRPLIFLAGSIVILFMLIAAWAAETVGNCAEEKRADFDL